MDLKIEDVADLLNVSESMILQWIAENKIPTYFINQEYRFSRNEIENWMLSHKLDNTHGISPFSKTRKDTQQSAKKTPSGSKQFGLFRAIYKGGVLSGIPGQTKEEVIRNTMKLVAKDLHVDADVMTDLLLDRESLMPTALSNGVAVPHTRDTLLHTSHDVVYIVFPQHQLQYGALDGKPVHTLFFLFACEDKRHLHLLAKIAHLSYQAETQEFLRKHPSKEQLLAYIKDWESHIPD